MLLLDLGITTDGALSSTCTAFLKIYCLLTGLDYSPTGSVPAPFQRIFVFLNIRQLHDIQLENSTWLGNLQSNSQCIYILEIGMCLKEYVDERSECRTIVL